MSRTDQVEHTDSISSQDPNREEPKKTKSRRPPSKNVPGRDAMCMRDGGIDADDGG